MDDFHDNLLRGRLPLVCSTESSTGWQDVLPKLLLGGRTGYHVKMRLDPENCNDQTYIKGTTRDTPREAAIWCAQYIYNNTFLPKDPGIKKVRLALAQYLSFPSMTAACACALLAPSQKRRKQAEGTLAVVETEREAKDLFPFGMGRRSQPDRPLEGGGFPRT